IGLYHERKRLATLHYYACHPMSFYGDGRVTSDFVGMARERLEKEDPGSLRLYFTGCAGNVAAGKYNDGSPAARKALADRMFAGMKAAEAGLEPKPVKKLVWSAAPLSPTPRATPDDEALDRIVRNPKASGGERGRAGFELAWRRRVEKKRPILVSSLHVDDISTLHLPGEPFIEYQLEFARKHAPRRLAVAGYGDGGPWYMPTDAAFPQGGYEATASFSGAGLEAEMRTAAHAARG
ncbi:MAG TPA: hypothetical protein VNC50_12860, partial [Planctomycetia bacterium]|nr:hypothetical protein [Planctomycetia bacterium]